jgi:hypothetical protein
LKAYLVELTDSAAQTQEFRVEQFWGFQQYPSDANDSFRVGDAIVATII